MAKRMLSCYYYKLTSSSKNIKNIKKVNEFLRNYNKNNVTESIDEHKYYITPYNIKKDDYICFSVAKVNTSEVVELDNTITQERKAIEKDEDEGLAKDAHFLYNYKSNIIVQRKGSGVATMKDLQEFLALKIECEPFELQLNLILEEDAMKKINKIEIFESIEFSVAVPKQLSIFNKSDDDIGKSISLAESLGADNLKFNITGKKLFKNRLLEAIESLRLQNSNSTIDLKKLSLYGENELIDLVKRKLGYYEEVEFKGKKIKEDDIYKFLISAYDNKKQYLEAYNNE